MTQTIIKFEAEVRDENLNPRQLRAAGNLPATIYGKGIDSVSVQVNAHEFIQTYKNNKEATFELSVGGKSYSVVVQNVQKNYATNDVLHIEFKLA
jgi:large subunit ribosomal protein L25